MADVMRTVSELLPENGIVTNGAGNFAAFVHRYFEYKGYRTLPCADLRLDGLRHCRRRSPPSSRTRRAPVVNVAGRRRFPHDRPGARDRACSTRCRSSPSSPTTACTARSACIRARVSPPRHRHDADQSRFCRLRPQLRRRRLHRSSDDQDFAPAFRAGACGSSKPSVIELKLDPGGDDRAPDACPRSGAAEPRPVSRRLGKKRPRPAAPADRDQFSPREEREADMRRAPSILHERGPGPHQALVACRVRLPSENTLRFGVALLPAHTRSAPKEQLRSTVHIRSGCLAARLAAAHRRAPSAQCRPARNRRG